MCAVPLFIKKANKQKAKAQLPLDLPSPKGQCRWLKGYERLERQIPLVQPPTPKGERAVGKA